VIDVSIKPGFRYPRLEGFVLTELLVAGLMATFLILGMVQMAAATSRGLSLIESLAQTQQGGRFAIEQMRSEIMAAGFHPRTWENSGGLGLSEASVDGGAGASDVLIVTRLSNRNCFDNLNSVLDGDGRPAWFLRKSTFERSGSDNLAHSCHYGPDEDSLVRQINRSGLVEGVESFQVLYTEDTDGDSRADRRVRAGHWNDIDQVIGVQLGLLLASDKPVGDRDESPQMVLDEAVMPRSDGRLRRVWTTTLTLESKLR
jgi:hypothetical protein